MDHLAFSGFVISFAAGVAWAARSIRAFIRREIADLLKSVRQSQKEEP